MLTTDLDVTRSVRGWLEGQLGATDVCLQRLQQGIGEAAWYSARDRRVMRAVCDAHPREFTRWLFCRDAEGRYMGLVMVWPARHATAIHDHAGLWGIEMVLQGALAVDDFEVYAGSGEPRFVGSTVLQEGESCAFLGSGGHAHRCTNPSPRRPAISLHVYGGLLDHYRTYREAAPRGCVPQRIAARIDGCIGRLPVAAV
jgi:predicted metal-dependent enzyme (double-stranded beta helix superfamily)